jgi:SpoVK/Ycf46/Vps4 family AAA+-type ATPase
MNKSNRPTFLRYKISTDNPMGDDVIMVLVYVQDGKGEEVWMPIIISFNELQEFTKTLDLKVHDYWLKISNSIGGYGPRDSKILAQMAEEEFDIEYLVKAFFSSLSIEKLLEHVEWSNHLRTARQTSESIKAAEMLQEIIPENAAENTRKFNDFLTELDQSMHETVLKYYPELFEMDEVSIKEYKSKLARAVLRFAEEVDSILHKRI